MPATALKVTVGLQVPMDLSTCAQLPTVQLNCGVCAEVARATAINTLSTKQHIVPCPFEGNFTTPKDTAQE
jgi:hypothetical protein